MDTKYFQTDFETDPDVVWRLHPSGHKHRIWMGLDIWCSRRALSSTGGALDLIMALAVWWFGGVSSGERHLGYYLDMYPTRTQVTIPGI